VIEDKATEALRAINAGESMKQDHRKGILAQFFGVQLVRGAAFFADRSRFIEVLDKVPADLLSHKLLAEANGDPERARKLGKERFREPTEALMAMLQAAPRVGGVLGQMRWHVIRFEKPRLVYSDQPVVVWPMGRAMTAPFTRPHLRPLEALEVRVPIGPRVGLLMNWIDQLDDEKMTSTPTVAAEFNAFTVGQAEKEWMHSPDHEPRVPWKSFEPLSRLIQEGYCRETAIATRRFEAARKFLASAANRRFVGSVPYM
jgi:hypothetical protein